VFATGGDMENNVYRGDFAAQCQQRGFTIGGNAENALQVVGLDYAALLFPEPNRADHRPVFQKGAQDYVS